MKSSAQEGYIKFACHWARESISFPGQVAELNRCRALLYDKGLLGAYPDGVGFGNISARLGHSSQFIITGTATGNKAQLGADDYTLVVSYDLSNNSVGCTGMVKASSESLSHAAFYEVNPEIKAVIHIHHLELWKSLYDVIPTTSPNVEYGTVEMAQEIERLLSSDSHPSGAVVMAGHKEGLFMYGPDLDRTWEVVLRLLP